MLPSFPAFARKHRSLIAGLGLAAFSATPMAQEGEDEGPRQAEQVAQPSFEFLGPLSAGRISAAAAVAGQPGVYFAGAASGGVWKSADGGETWTPTFDDQESQAIGALAVSANNPNIVWAGTGEAWAVRDMDMEGDGIYKSTDGGETWTNMGLEATGRIGTIVIDPRDDDVVMVCALGRATGPQQERGVFRTENGGRSWKRTLFVNEDTGCSGLQQSQQNPDIVIAGTWEIFLATHVLESGGMGSGIWLSKDGGRSFERLEHEGLPKSPYGKTDVAIAPSDDSRMYALVQTGRDGVKGLPSEAQGSLWRSDDGGATWASVSWDRRLIGRAGYYIRIRVAPDDPDHLMIANSSLWESIDGGRTFERGPRGCGDCHDIWWDVNADAPGHFIITGDGGMTIYGSPLKPDGGTRVRLPIGQMYRVTVDQRDPYWVYSDRQDNGSMRIASDAPIVPPNVPSYAPPPEPEPEEDGDGLGFGPPQRELVGPAQERMPSCESGYTYPEPGNHHFVWGTCYAAHVATYDDISGLFRSVSPWQHTLDSDPVGLKYRCQWSPPLAIDWFDNSVYFGCQVILRTRDRGQSWEVISPDLSTGDPSRILFSGGVVGDNLGQFYGATISAIAPSRTEQGVVWVGTNDGKVWISRDAGATWEDLSANVDMPPWGLVRRIDASHHEPGTAYMAVDYHLVDNRDPYLYRTTDYGQSWTRLDGDLPRGHPLDYTLSIAEHPQRPEVLFAGTGHAFFYSQDGGRQWTRFKDRLPAVPVNWIEVPENAAEVAIGTYGRGIWILRDVWRLEVSDEEAASDTLVIHTPRPATRHASGGTAEFVFTLNEAPAEALTMEVLDRVGRRVSGSEFIAHEGMNRISWDMRYPAPALPVLRSLPPDNPYIWEAGRWEQREREVSHWGLGAAEWQPSVAPGQYTLRITHAGRSYEHPFEVRADVELPSSDDDLVASTKLQLAIIDAIDTVVDRINRIEVMRAKVEDLLDGSEDAELSAALRELYLDLYNAELHYLSRTEMHSDDKWYVEKYRLYMNLVWLLAEVGGRGGDVFGGAGYRPTDAAVDVFDDRLREIEAAESDFAALLLRVDDLNERFAGKVPPVTDDPAGLRGLPLN
ncbi:MAG: hypothetical protein V2I82_06540 [Halieaceae bacterium]|jgi:photosystem II stability/assembly factor-like uncharacterized protein|nr:hypothetical protein [Halieaceae bacterium]